MTRGCPPDRSPTCFLLFPPVAARPKLGPHLHSLENEVPIAACCGVSLPALRGPDLHPGPRAANLPTTSLPGTPGSKLCPQQNSQLVGLRKYAFDPVTREPNSLKQLRQRRTVLEFSARIPQIPWTRRRSGWDCPDNGVPVPMCLCPSCSPAVHCSQATIDLHKVNTRPQGLFSMLYYYLRF